MVKSKKIDQTQELDAKYKRALADYQNLEKRFAADRANLIKFTNAALLEKLLVIIDDLERAQAYLNDPGLGHVLNQFNRVLESEGVKIIDSDNKPFDPLFMDCAEVVRGEKNIVINTRQKGYQYHDKVLRPARVEVGDGTKILNPKC